MRFLLAILCALLVSAVVRIAWADSGRDAGRLESLADAAAASGDSQRAVALLRQATEANPRLTSAWLSLGLAAESAGDVTEAESVLKQAARFDHEFLPAWALVNCYFRRADRADCWNR